MLTIFSVFFYSNVSSIKLYSLLLAVFLDVFCFAHAFKVIARTHAAIVQAYHTVMLITINHASTVSTGDNCIRKPRGLLVVGCTRNKPRDHCEEG